MDIHPDEDDAGEYDDLAAVCFGVLERTGSVSDALAAATSRHVEDWELPLPPRVVERLEQFLESWREVR